MLGRWTAADPKGLAAASPGRADAASLYAYVTGRPTVAVDPGGRDYDLVITPKTVIVKVTIDVWVPIPDDWAKMSQQARVDAAAKEIQAANEKFWNAHPWVHNDGGTKRTVKFEFDVRGRSTTEDEGGNQFRIQPLTTEEQAEKVGAVVREGRRGVIPKENLRKQPVVRHETGHMLGLNDDDTEILTTRREDLDAILTPPRVPGAPSGQVREEGKEEGRVNIMNSHLAAAPERTQLRAEAKQKHIDQIVREGLKIHKKELEELRAEAMRARAAKPPHAADLAAKARELQKHHVVHVHADASVVNLSANPGRMGGQRVVPGPKL